MYRLAGCLLLLIAASATADPLFEQLQSAPASVDVCSYLSEDQFRDKVAVDGDYFSQSVDQAYQRLADEQARAPSFAGCWWRIAFDNGGFIMLQLFLHPAGSEEALRRVDGQLEQAAEYDSPLLPRPVEGLGEAGFWSPLSRRLIWRQGDSVIAELMLSESAPAGEKRKFPAKQLEEKSIQIGHLLSQQPAGL